MLGHLSYRGIIVVEMAIEPKQHGTAQIQNF